MGLLSVIALTAAAAAGGAPDDARLCRHNREPTKAEWRYLQVRRSHHDFGMSTSREHLESHLPEKFNARERSYVRDRFRVQRRAGEALAFLGDADGGLSIEDDYPRGAYLRIRHVGTIDRAAMRRQVDARLRFRRVEFTQDELTRAANDGEGFRALGRQGVEIVNAIPLLDRNRVRYEYRSAREDAGAAIRRRYGRVALTRKLPARRTRLVCSADVQRAVVDGGTLTLTYFTNSVYEFERVHVREDGDVVRVGIVERAPDGLVTQVGATRRVDIELDLAGRRLVDLHDRRPIPVG